MLNNSIIVEHMYHNETNGTSGVAPHAAIPMFGVIFKIVYAIGIIGNATAIIALRRGERRVRNRKHLLLLTSLAANDLVALVGMLCLMLVSDHVPGLKDTRGMCAARVVLRVFGIGSVCIAVTMALERYLALTRPFLYQKQVTYYVIRMALLVSWFFAAILTCAPIFGLGLYYNGEKCIRYRDAVNASDFAYAVVYVAFGTSLCVVLVYCNLAVIRALLAITALRPGAGGPPIVRRVSKTSCRQRELQRSLNSGNNLQVLHHNAATAEEVAFSRVMAMLSVLFMICWMPQMLTSALYLASDSDKKKKLVLLAKLSDMLMLFNYVLDPILYVLMRQRRRLSATGLCHSIAHCFKRNHKTSTESVSMKTSCCPQDTSVVMSDSSGELRPLRGANALLMHPAGAGAALTLKIDD